MVISECIFDQQVSDYLQHVAVAFEISAVVLLILDRRNYQSDTGRQFRASIAGATLPKKTRSTEFRIAIGVGVLAVLMEIYQLLTQYLGC